jgi:putative phosphoribosyl transferase
MRLAKRLTTLRPLDPVIVALPRGGVPVGFEVAKVLKAPFDVFVVRKITIPGEAGFGIGAITEGDFYWVDMELVHALELAPGDIERALYLKSIEVEVFAKRFRQGAPFIDVRDRAVILVDDGLITGVTAVVASERLKQLGAERVIFAAPVCSGDRVAALREHFDGVYFVDSPPRLYSLGASYEEHLPVLDEEIEELLKQRAA